MRSSVLIKNCKKNCTPHRIGNAFSLVLLKWTHWTLSKMHSHIMNGNDCILNQISVEFDPKGLNEESLSLVKVMVWRRTGCEYEVSSIFGNNFRQWTVQWFIHDDVKKHRDGTSQCLPSKFITHYEFVNLQQLVGYWRLWLAEHTTW